MALFPLFMQIPRPLEQCCSPIDKTPIGGQGASLVIKSRDGISVNRYIRFADISAILSNIGYRYQMAFNRYKYGISDIGNDKISDIGWDKLIENIGYRLNANIGYREKLTDMPSLIKSKKMVPAVLSDCFRWNDSLSFASCSINE